MYCFHFVYVCSQWHIVLYKCSTQCALLSWVNHLSMLIPGMVAIANPGAAELVTFTGRLAASMRVGVMICVTVFASALQDPAAFSRYVEEGSAGTFGLFAPALHAFCPQ